MLDIAIASNDNNNLNSILALEENCFPDDHWNRDIILSEFKKNHSYFVVGKINGDIVCYANFSLIYDEGELNRICVIPHFRHKGYAYILIDYIIGFLKKNSCKKLMLEVRSKNQNAVSLYQKHNFTVDCIRKNYYSDPVDDAILMTCEF